MKYHRLVIGQGDITTKIERDAATGDGMGQLIGYQADSAFTVRLRQFMFVVSKEDRVLGNENPKCQ